MIEDIRAEEGFPLQLRKVWPPGTIAVGMIGIEMPAERPAIADWPAWLSEQLPDQPMLRFGSRFGRHLWVYALFGESEGSADADGWDALARRLCALLGARQFGAAIAEGAGAGRTSPAEAGYAAFVNAAAGLAGAPSAQSQSATAESAEMQRILQEGGIRSVYQPLFRLKNGSLFGYEALTRCLPGSPFDGPLALFRYAEKEGCSFALDRIARETAVRSCPALADNQKIFININSGIMKDPHFVSGQTLQWLAERGLAPDQVVFELTERSSIDDFEEAKKTLSHYRSQGYEIAIDDAGAGYSSLQAIVELRPDYIKVDRSLVQNADRDEMKKHMLRTFVRFAKRMNIRIVAEGIERPEELHLVRMLGIDFGQGYLIGRPSEKPAIMYPARGKEWVTK